jgi:hypothetical protein
MSVAELCQICEAAEARHTCEACGRQVCDDHFDREERVCVACARGDSGVDDVGPGPTR